jgi:hypothetical protein
MKTGENYVLSIGDTTETISLSDIVTTAGAESGSSGAMPGGTMPGGAMHGGAMHGGAMTDGIMRDGAMTAETEPTGTMADGAAQGGTMPDGTTMEESEAQGGNPPFVIEGRQENISEPTESEDDAVQREASETKEISTETKVIWGISILVLAAGLAIVICYKRK